MHHETEVRLLEVLPTGLYCLQTNGKECVVGCDRQALIHPPPIGSVLTVRYTGNLRNGLLRKPFYWRIRTDLSWDDLSSHQRTMVDNAAWTNQQNIRNFFELASQKLNHQTLKDFYGITKEEIHRLGGTALLENVFKGSLVNALGSVYPNHEWLPWMFKQYVPKGFWKQKENHKKYMIWLGQQLNFKQMNDWYKLRASDVKQYGGHSVLEIFGNSPTNLVQSIFSDHQWLPWRFEALPHGYWDNNDNQRLFMDWLAKELDIRHKSSWRRVTTEDVTKRGGYGLLWKYKNSIQDLAKTVYPQKKKKKTN